MIAKCPGVRLVVVALLVAGFACGTAFCSPADDQSASPQSLVPVDSGLYLKMRLANPVKISKLRPGDVVEGSLARDVYGADRKLFPAGSRVRLTVDYLEKRQRPPDDHWPWVVKAFTPRHESFPVFRAATIAQAEGESSLPVSLISFTRMREVHA